MRRLVLFLALICSNAHADKLYYSHDIVTNIHADYLGGAYTKWKLVWGDDGAANDVSLSNPWPIQGPILTTIDSDLLAFKASNHTDLTLLDTDLNAFKSQNHLDLTLIDTDLFNFKTANHTDLTAINSTQTSGAQKTQVVDGSNVTLGPAQTIDAVNYFPFIAYFQEAFEAYKGFMFTSVLDSAALSGTTEVPLIYINNPNGSGKSIRLYYISFGPTLGNNYVTYRLYKDATVTANGTPMTITGNRQTGQATTVVSAFSTPTTSANGTLIHTMVASGLSGQDVVWNINFSQILEANHNYILTRKLSANATIGGVDIEWSEK